MKKPTKKLILFLLILMSCLFLIVGCADAPKYKVVYEASRGGVIVGKAEQLIKKEQYTEKVVAVANEGYKFIKWSDGITTEERTDQITQARLHVTAIFSQITFSVNYFTSEGGCVKGKANQTIGYGDIASQVIAEAKSDYEFIGWSDGKQEHSRIDENIKADFEVKALFHRVQGTFAYNYNKATSNNNAESIHMQRGKLTNINLIVPEKQYFTFNGWYLDPIFCMQISDEKGRLIVGDEIFDGTLNLYAKWTVNEEIVYKILMIFDTEVKADLVTAEGEIVKVDYKMSDVERKVCETMVYQFSKYLNDIFDGLVIFEIDSYFTTIPLGIENISVSKGTTMEGSPYYEYSIEAADIPEIRDRFDNYRCVINTVSFDDYDDKLRTSGGHADEKFAVLFFEGLVGQTLLNNQPLEALLDLNHGDWGGIIEGYAHEFAHTIEQGITVYQYHRAVAEGLLQGLYRLEPTTLYLINQLTVSNETEKIGIPYSYWKNEFLYVEYLSAEGGYVDTDWANGWTGHVHQRVPKGSNANEVMAIAIIGYRFVEWSDGVKTAVRHDLVIEANFTVTAKFEKMAFEVNYNASVGGTIIGNSKQKVTFREWSESVKAVAKEGYRFVGWSDGNKNAERSDFVGINPSGELPKFIFTAIFEKVDIIYYNSIGGI